MTIDNSRIYVGTIEREIAAQGDIATTDISSELDSLDRVVLISFKTKNDEVKYVPFSYIANPFKFLTISLAARDSEYDERFISLKDEVIGNTPKEYITEIERLFEEDGESSLEDLEAIQKEFFAKHKKVSYNI